jgi:hypothetical protein
MNDHQDYTCPEGIGRLLIWAAVLTVIGIVAFSLVFGVEASDPSLWSQYKMNDLRGH